MIRSMNDFELNYINELSDYKVDKSIFSNIIVYELDNEIVAYLDYSVIYERAEVNYIFVKENYRKRNIASKLLQYILDNYKLENITLEVNVNNLAAIKLYEKIGFKIVSKRERYYDGTDAYLMEMML